MASSRCLWPRLCLIIGFGLMYRHLSSESEESLDQGDCPEGDDVDGELLVAGAQAAALLEPADHALDPAALAVAGLVEALLARLVGARRDDRLDPPPPQPAADARVAVALVPGQLPRP